LVEQTNGALSFTSMSKSNKRIIAALVIFMLLVVTIFIFRVSILKAVGNALISEDMPIKPTVLFVLSGGAFDRANRAYQIYKLGKATHIYCTGSNKCSDLKALGLDVMEGEITARYLAKLGVPDSLVSFLPEGTSTLEEGECIRKFAEKYALTDLAVVSSKFHTSRVRWVLERKLKNSHVKFHVIGAASSEYNEECWWKSENGLIAANNEWIKKIYYGLKY